MIKVSIPLAHMLSEAVIDYSTISLSSLLPSFDRLNSTFSFLLYEREGTKVNSEELKIFH